MSTTCRTHRTHRLHVGHVGYTSATRVTAIWRGAGPQSQSWSFLFCDSADRANLGISRLLWSSTRLEPPFTASSLQRQPVIHTFSVKARITTISPRCWLAFPPRLTSPFLCLFQRPSPARFLFRSQPSQPLPPQVVSAPCELTVFPCPDHSLPLCLTLFPPASASCTQFPTNPLIWQCLVGAP